MTFTMAWYERGVGPTRPLDSHNNSPVTHISNRSRWRMATAKFRNDLFLCHRIESVQGKKEFLASAGAGVIARKEPQNEDGVSAFYVEGTKNLAKKKVQVYGIMRLLHSFTCFATGTG